MPITYFCLEYATEDNLPIYAGGLGILAGDLVLEAGSLGLDFIALGLFYNHGVSETSRLDPTRSGFKLEPFTIPVEVGQDPINVQVWSKNYGTARLFLLDAGEITKFLYGPNQETMLKQQIVLGVGGIRLLQKLNITPTTYHLNEGHTWAALLELALDRFAQNPSESVESVLKSVGSQTVATKHTILTGAGLHLTSDQLDHAVGPYLKTLGLDSRRDLFPLGVHPKHPDNFSTTNFLLHFASHQSGVSHLHTVMEKTTHPESRLIPITNGVNIPRWDKLETISSKGLWENHLENKKNLFGFLDLDLNLDSLTVVWARRLTTYKRPQLLFADMKRLSQLVNGPKPIQFIIAGKTNLADTAGQELADLIRGEIKKANLGQKVIFLENHDLSLAEKLVAGADVWLNTPIPGQEACGTSGMKAALNGALMLSTNDGWMAEVDWHDLGWILPEENISTALYDILEKEIAPLYYTNPSQWQQRSLRTRSLILDYFNTKRVLEDYQSKLYLTPNP